MADPVTSALAVIRTVLEGGWRVGLLALLMGGGIWTADALSIPREGTFKEWIPLAAASTILGLAAMLTSAIIWILERMVEKFQSNREAVRAAKDAVANLSTLTFDEGDLLLGALRQLPERIEINDDASASALLQKKIFCFVAETGHDRTLDEVHPAIAAMKDELLNENNKHRLGARPWPRTRS